jgi:cytochrome P450
MQMITTRQVVSGIGVELPFIMTLGQILTFIPIPAIKDIFGQNDVLAEHGRRHLESIKASETSSNIFSNVAAEGEIGEKLSIEDVLLEASDLIIAGTDEDYGDPDLEKLPLLNAVVEETLRLYGAAPAGLPRSVPSGGVTIVDQVIPAGTTVTTQAYTYHRDPALFPRPLE